MHRQRATRPVTMFVAQSTTGGTGGTWRLEQVEVSIDTPDEEIEAVAERRLRETLADDDATIYWCVWDVPTLGELAERCSESSTAGSNHGSGWWRRRRTPPRCARRDKARPA